MKVTISNKNKKDLFVALFQIIKGCTSVVRIIFQQDKMYIQGMDKSHISSSFSFDGSSTSYISKSSPVFR